MCCLVSTLLLLGPRAGILVWWLMQNERWNLTFQGWIVPLIGFIIAPWTTLAYVAVYPGGIQLFDWIILGIAVLLDLGSWFGGYRNRRNVPYVY
jgi:hypothetical protein